MKRQIIFYDKDCGDILLRKIMGGTEMLTLSKLEKIASRSEVLLPSAVSAPSVGTILEVFREPIFRISHSFFFIKNVHGTCSWYQFGQC